MLVVLKMRISVYSLDDCDWRNGYVSIFTYFIFPYLSTFFKGFFFFFIWQFFTQSEYLYFDVIWDLMFQFLYLCCLS